MGVSGEEKKIEKARKFPGERYTPRERVWKILEHEEPDRVSADLSVMKQAYFNLKHYLHLPIKFTEIDFWPSAASYNPWWEIAPEEAICRRFRIDFRSVGISLVKPFVPQKLFPNGSFIDDWGFHRKAGNTYLEFISPWALENAQTMEEIEEDPYWADIEKTYSVDGLAKRARRLDDAGYAVFVSCPNPGGGIFESASWRRGPHKLMEDMYLRPKMADAILEKVLELSLEAYGILLDEVSDFCTIVGTSDDLGSQNSGLMSLRTYRKYIKPRQKKLNDLIHKKTDAKIYLHSCGNMEMYINDLVEIGVDVLNPVQPECPDMHLEDLKEKYGDKLTFCGGIGSQHILPRGSVYDVEAEVKRAIKAAAQGGGYIVAPGHVIQPEVSPWNICAMYDAVLKYGWYPIKL
jgi:uroporphyrinogen decarboxylase